MSVEPARLVVYLEGREVQVVELNVPVLPIGRTPDNGLALPHPLVARRHAEIRVADGAALLTDLGGSAGTFVGAERLLPNQPRQLSDGDTLRIGPFTLLYRAPAAPRAEADDGAAEAPPPKPPEAPELAEAPAPQAPLLGGPRPRYPAPAASGPASRYLRDLPVVYHSNEFLGRFLQIFESVWEPLEHRQDHIDMYFDPRTCPAELLPWLASWLDLPLDEQWPEPRKRALLTEAFEIYRWRGTRYGLSRVIELSTGLTPEILDEPGMPFVMRVRVAAPADSAVDRRELEELICAHKPAHVGYILELRRAT